MPDIVVVDDPQVAVVIQPPISQVTVVSQPTTHHVVSVGYRGERGVGADLSFIHNQAVPDSTWSITHNLGKYPSVTVVDSAGTVVEGDVEHVSINQVLVSFSSGFSGQAFLN